MSSKSGAERAPSGPAGRNLGEGGSIATRLTLWYTGSAFILVLSATGFLYWTLARNLEREDAEFLADQVHIMGVLLREHPGDLKVLQQEVEVESSARQHARVFIRVLTEDGRILTETSGMTQETGPDRFPAPIEASLLPTRAVEIRSASGKPFEIAAARVPGHVIQVALDATHEKQFLSDFRSRMLPILAVTLVLSAVVGYRIAKRGIRPVEEISEIARRIRSSTLNERIAADRLPEELSPLAATINEMLARLEEAFARLSRFSADIAHELRTPLNNLRGETEVALGKARTQEEYRDVLGSSLEEYARLSRLIESLLFLARAEDPGTQIHKERVDVGRELASVRDFYEAAAGEAGVSLEVRAAGGVEAGLDRTLFQRAAGNLVDNALAHTASGGSVTLTASRDNGTVRVEVADTGCGIAPEHLPRVFDRLYRVDRSRTAATGGAGLGLAIVKSIAELHGGTASIASDVGKGTRVTLLFPAGEMTKS
jgi:two-component system, OmpR family, heavy metal sensor histidine kinase CusS